MVKTGHLSILQRFRHCNTFAAAFTIGTLLWVSRKQPRSGGTPIRNAFMSLLIFYSAALGSVIGDYKLIEIHRVGQYI